MDIKDEFVDEQHKKRYKIVLGHKVATSLSGFIAGVILTSILWALAIYLHSLFFGQ